MSGEIIPFNQVASQGGLAQYLANPEFAGAMAEIEKDVTIYASFPLLSIKGKAWTVVQGDERKVLMKPDNSGEQVQILEGVFLRINDQCRTYYAGDYEEGKENVKPTCYSNDNITPSDRSVQKQSPKCATCQWSVFGTARKKDGTAGKGTACASNARIAIATPGELDKPYLLRVPPTSLRPMREAIDAVKQRKIPYPVVLMKLAFVAEEASPVLRIVPAGLLNQGDGVRAIKLRDDSTVRAICGLDDVHQEVEQLAAPAPAENLASGLDAAIAQRAATPTITTAAPTPNVTSPVSQPVVTSASPAAVSSPPVTATTTATAAAPTPTPPVVAQPTIAPSEPKVTVAQGDLLGELGALLGNLDG